jgi:CHAT domain-containing protein/Tfp pilus assembly protein PilF
MRVLLPRSICLTLLTLATLPLACSNKQKAAKEAPITKQVGSASDTTLAGRYFAKAEQFGKIAEYDSARAYFKIASALYKAQANWEHYVRCYNQIGWCAINSGAYDEAEAYLDTALEVGRNRLGEQHPILANTYNYAGQTYWDKGDYDQSLASLNKALSIQLANHQEKDLLSASIYNNLATVYWGKGDYDEATALYEKALQIQLATTGEQHYNVVIYYNNMGLAFSQKKDYEKSSALHKKALSILPSLVGEQDPYVAETYINLGHAHWGKDDNDEALAFYKKALSIQLATIGEAHPDLSLTYSNMGDAYSSKREYDRALIYYRKTLALELTTYGARHPDVAEVYLNLAAVCADKGDQEEALKFYQQAIVANIPEFNDNDPYANPKLEAILSENLLLETLARKAEAMANLSDKSHRLPDLEFAVSTYELAGQLIDRMRSGYKAEGSKLFLAEKTTDIYDRAIRRALQIYAATCRDEYKDAAFQFAERSKAGIMLDALSEAEAKQFAGIPDSLLQKERQLRVDLAFYERSLTEEQLQGEAADSANLAHLKDKVFNLKQAYNELLQRFEKEYPDYYNLKYQVKTVTVPEVQQQLLDDQTALAEYFTGEDSIFIFAITKNNFAIKVSAKNSLFERQIEQLRQGITKQDINSYTQAAYRLHQTLLAPVADLPGNKNLIIVPDGALSAIPFEALLMEHVAGGKLQDYAKLPYLINKHAISYAYSATLLQQQLNKHDRATKRDYLALAPVFTEGLPAGTRGAEFFEKNFAYDSSQTAATATATVSATRLRGYLPMTKKEVTGILERFENSYGFFERWFGNKSRVYLEREANEARLKAGDLGEYRILHFATHGLVNEKNPKLSGLLLAQEDTTSKEDGILHLGEIYNLSLNADLVVLSACETGLGQIAKGEGIIGLTRGFLYAGASNLLVSLWQVSDATTADLMVDFYDKMLGGMSKPEALREAKLQMIRRHAEYAKPYYWAPFILVGE